MTFGKYEGYELGNIPLEYLIWIDDNIPSTSPDKQMKMKAFVKAELKRRSTPASADLMPSELQINIDYKQRDYIKKWQ